MSRPAVVKCDGVGCPHTTPIDRQGGWFQVNEQEADLGYVEVATSVNDAFVAHQEGVIDLCSVSCLMKWIARWAGEDNNNGDSHGEG